VPFKKLVTQKYVKDGSIVIVDAFNSYHPDLAGMKKLVASPSGRAIREERKGVTAITNMGFFFLFGGDGQARKLIDYETSLPVKTGMDEEGGNVRGFSCYNKADYETLSND
jgi:hypothetical protein